MPITDKQVITSCKTK